MHSGFWHRSAEWVYGGLHIARKMCGRQIVRRQAALVVCGAVVRRGFCLEMAIPLEYSMVAKLLRSCYCYARTVRPNSPTPWLADKT